MIRSFLIKVNRKARFFLYFGRFEKILRIVMLLYFIGARPRCVFFFLEESSRFVGQTRAALDRVALFG